MIPGLSLKIINVLASFDIKGKFVRAEEGPMLIMAYVEPAPGTLFSSIKRIEGDVGRSLGISGVRVVEVPNSTNVCFEIPSNDMKSVPFAPILYSAEFLKAAYALPICLGVDMRGNPVMKDLSKMPHLLVAGTTGSGKSVGLNSFIVSLISKKTPQELKLVLIDPKRIEFSIYNNQQYMLRPVITDMNIASICLSQLVDEMNSRYTQFEAQAVRNIGEYNAKAGAKMPYIVCVIDEFADLVMFDKTVEQQVQILAQKSRAAGIHLIIATQRPSVDVITGSLKANLPTRLSYKVASATDSMTILNTSGAESLFGRGDSLFLEENGTLTRILGAFITNDDIENALTPYRCKMPAQTSVYDLAKERNAEKRSANKPAKGGFFVWICDMWNRLGVRNQIKIIKSAVALLAEFISVKSTSTTIRKKKKTKQQENAEDIILRSIKNSNRR